MKQEMFSEALSNAIRESSISISKLAVLSGLGRTAIQHVLSGDFLPTRAFLDKLLNCLPITKEQHSELTDLYLMEKIGKKQFLSNRHIAQMIEDIPDFFQADIQTVNIQSTPIPESLTDEVIAENGLMNVLTLCSHLYVDECMRENPYIAITIPFSCKEYFHSLIHTMNAINKPIKIDHFGRLLTDDDTYINFEKLHTALKFSLRPELEYTPYYYYSKSSDSDDFFSAYPYYLATHSHAILISEDMTKAVMIHSKRFVSQVMSHITELRNRSKLFYRLIDGTEIEKLVYTLKTNVISLSYQSLFTNMIPMETIIEGLSDKYRTEDNIARIKEYYRMNPSNKCVSNISVEGLMMFARTGRIMNAPAGYLDDLSVSERIKILERCKYSDIFRLVDPAALSLSDSIKVYSLSSKTVVIIVRNDWQVIRCRIDESLLVDGINAFLSSLDKSGFLLDEEHRSAAIDMCIEAAKASAV